MEALKLSHSHHLPKLTREVSIMSATNHYATDLSDEQWAILEPPDQDARQATYDRSSMLFSMSIRPAVSGGCCPRISTPGIRFMAISGGGVARGCGRVGWSNCVMRSVVAKGEGRSPRRR